MRLLFFILGYVIITSSDDIQPSTLIIIIIIIIITSNDDIQPSTVVTNQSPSGIVFCS